MALLERLDLFGARLMAENAKVAVEPLLKLAAILDGVAYLHAASPKKSLAVTLPPVARTIRDIRFLSGMRSPATYRRMVSGVTPIRSAKA